MQRLQKSATLLPMNRNDIRVLLVQFRDDPVIKQKEFDSFVEYMQLTPEHITVADATTEDLTASMLDSVDALVVAGNGGASVTQADELRYTDGVKAILREAYTRRMPTLAVCFGAQYAALEFGGTVERVESMRETGTYPLTLTEDGQHDPIFDGIPKTFNGQQGHNDSIITLPEGTVRLTESERVPNQAFRFPDRCFYAVQYHPELDEEQLRFRFEYYKHEYADNMEAFQKILDNIQESTDASAILSRFIDLALEELSQ